MVVVIPLCVMIVALCLFVTFKAMQADRSLLRARRRIAGPRTPQQKRMTRLLLATYPAFMVLGAVIGALVDTGDPVGGAIIGFIAGMFAWVPAIWIFSFVFSLEVARRKWLTRGRETDSAPGR